MSIDLVIFDCDGVLVDSEPLGVEVDLMVLREAGISITEQEVIDRFVGRSANALVETVTHHLGEPVSDDWLARYRRLRKEAFELRLTAVKAVAEVLDSLHAETCVASSSTLDSLQHKLEIVGLAERFLNRLFSAEEVPRGKPAPDLFLHAAREMGSEPSACVVVEDSSHGVEAGRKAGMRVLAFAGGLIPAASLAGPSTIVFREMGELAHLLHVLDARSP
jgi:HAD superfamily hydrolase (TIGR01509 family)